jgi:hypothetical protein
VVDLCPEWKEPQFAAQYYGSANKGLGFYHIDVAARVGRFKHWAGFDNFGVFTVEEGELGEDEIVQTLKTQIDKGWQWMLLKMDDYRYLVKFPPHIKVERKVLGKATFFYLKNEEVMASLRVWNGDIEPVGQLEEVWVQITGIPPKWCDWITIKEIASSLGKLCEIDWQTLFSSFFSVVRVRIKCKDPRAIPEDRVMELDDQLFLIHFKVENVELEESAPPEEKGKEDESDEDGSTGDPEKPQDPSGREEKEKEDKDRDRPGQGEDKTSGAGQKSGQKTTSVRRVLQLDEEPLAQKLCASLEEGFNCADLLQAMEIGGEEDEEEGNHMEEDEMLLLPDEWVYSTASSIEKEGTTDTQDSNFRGEENSEEVREVVNISRGGTKTQSQAEKKQWGPIVVERRSKRLAEDGRTIAEKAQEIKRKWNETSATGKPTQKSSCINANDLRYTASVIGLVGRDGNPVSSDLIEKIANLEAQSSKSLKEKCDHMNCVLVGNRVQEDSRILEHNPNLNSVDTEDFSLIKSRVETNIHNGRVVDRARKKGNDWPFLEH